MNNRPKASLSVLASAVLTLTLWSCQSPEAGKINLVLDWSVNTNHTGAFVARDMGFFKEEGLEVEILSPPETGAAGALLAGQAQFIYSYQEEVTLAGAGGQDLVAVAAVLQSNTSGFAAPSEKAIRRPRDFEGKIYGGWGSPMEEAVLKALMESDGGDFSKLKIVNMGSMDYFTAVKTSVDFAWIFQGWTGVEAQLRGENLDYIDLSAYDQALNYYTPVIAARGEWLTAQGETAKKFLKALARGYVYAAAEPVKAAEILLKAAPELEPTLVKASQSYITPYYGTGGALWGRMDAGRWTAFSRWLEDRGLLSTPRDPEKLFTNDYLP